jgi:putative flippase GtrA
MSTWLRESTIYTVGAAAAFATDIGLLWTQVEWFGMHYLLAATLSFMAGSVVIYWVSIRYAFAHRRIEDNRIEFASFVAIGASGVLLNLGLMAALVEWLHFHYIAAKVASATVTFVGNLGARKWLLFTHRPTAATGATLARERPKP